MRLIVLSTATGIPSPTQEPVWTLRLTGTARPWETAPPDLLLAADEAAAHLRDTFPDWLWTWVKDSGLLNLQVWAGPVSWWWFTPLSEKSPLRSPVIRELYWMTLLRQLLKRKNITAIDWYGDDTALAFVAEQVSAQCGVAFRPQVKNRPRQTNWFRTLRRLGCDWVDRLFCSMLLKLFKFGNKPDDLRHADVVLFSRFPILWEQEGTSWRERMYGQWPEYLTSQGHRVAYAAPLSTSFRTLWRNRHQWRDVCKQQNICLLEEYPSLWTLARAHANGGLMRRYARWKSARQHQGIDYEGLNIAGLFWRELDANSCAGELASDRCIAAGIRALLERMPAARCVCLPFEYQPMERAVWAGVKTARDIPLVGLQTGLFTSNHMGTSFVAREIRGDPLDPDKSPLPEFLVAYGDLAYRIFVDRIGTQRVCRSGPIRYPHLGDTDEAQTKKFKQEQALPSQGVFVLVTTSISREESLPLLERAFAISAEQPDLFLCIKFHYHLPLHEETQRLAAKSCCQRYQIFDAGLPQLLQLAPIMLCAGSSTGIEALAAGAMPLVFRLPGEMSCNPMLDVPEAVFFWHSLDELRHAMHSAVMQDAAYQRRRAAWPKAIASHLHQLDGKADSRLYQFLCQSGIW